MFGWFGRRHLRRGFVAWACAAALVGCAGPGSQRIVGPDGSPMAHVHCGGDQGSCFRIAGELCPHGYDFRPVLSGSDGNFLVRCHAESGIQAAAPAPASTSVLPHHPAPSLVVAVSARPAQAWPPTTEPAPAANPWPAPVTSAAASRTVPVTTPPGELDLGY
jgi:hypothetical protein